MTIDEDKKMKNILDNPDMSFCNFIISGCMFILSLVTFYSHRNFNDEYFNRQLIYKRVDDNPLGFINYNQVSSVEDFENFMNDTIGL